MTVTPKPEATHTHQLDSLRTLRDELRVQAHLGGLEAKDAWSAIEPQFDSLVQEAVAVGFISINAVNAVFQELKHLVAAVQHERGIQNAKRESRT